MKRGIVLGALVLVGVLSLGVKAYQPPADGPKVVEVEKLKDNLYVLRGGGGNTAVFLTASGVIVVDAKNPGWGKPILDKIKELTPKPVTTLINTHTHGDHVSGNVEFPATIDFVAQENARHKEELQAHEAQTSFLQETSDRIQPAPTQVRTEGADFFGGAQ